MKTLTKLVTVVRYKKWSSELTLRLMSSKTPNSRPDHVTMTKDQWRDDTFHELKIEQIDNLSSTVKSLTLKLADSDTTMKPSFKAGQWVDFAIPNVSQVGGYSITSTPSRLAESGRLDLAVKRSEWAPAKWIHTQAKVNDTVHIKFGGEFHYPNQKSITFKGQNVLLIAGGVGINPLYSILQVLAESSDPTIKTQLMYSARKKEDLIFKSHIDKLCDAFQGFGVSYYLTREPRPSRIGLESIREKVGRFSDPKQLLCFLCGPRAMIEDMNNHLKTSQVPQENIFYELWW